MKASLENIKSLNLDEMEYDYFGIRADDYQYNVGDIANYSHQLFQDPDFDEEGNLIYKEGQGIYAGYYDAGELDGTCCIGFQPDSVNSIQSALNAISHYYASNLYIIAGNYAECGIDDGETIIRDAVVIGVINDQSNKLAA